MNSSTDTLNGIAPSKWEWKDSSRVNPNWTTRIRPGLLGLGLVALFSGCADLSVLQPTVDSTVFYYIDSPMNADQASTLDRNGPAVLVGPSSLAKYLDQPQIVTSSKANELEFSELQRWAEPLDENITRVLIDHLSIGLNSSQVGFLRVMGTMEWDYRIGYHVFQLTGSPGKKVQLQVSWWVEKRASGTRQFRESIYEETVMGGSEDYAAYVRAIGQMIEKWANEVTDMIQDE